MQSLSKKIRVVYLGAVLLAALWWPAASVQAVAIYYFQFGNGSTAQTNSTPGAQTIFRAFCDQGDGWKIYTYPVYSGYPDPYTYAGGGEIGNGGGLTYYFYPTVTTQYWLACQDNQFSGYAHAHYGPITLTVQQPDNCPTAATLASGNGAGFSVGPGVRNLKGTINGTAYNFCVNNQTGSTFFVALSTPAEFTAFYNATQGALASSISYFARNPGY